MSPGFQHHSTGVPVIISFLSMRFKYILSACLVEHFRETLLECNNKVIDMYNVSFPYSGEVEVYLGTSGCTQIKDNVGYSP